MNKIAPIALFLLLFVCVLKAQTKPNIVLIMADDMGYECLNCNGGTDYTTPVLDQMAKEGLRFTNAYSNVMCTPSRVKIMTGKYNYQNYKAFAYMDHQDITFGNILRDAGYSTMVAGKWQLNGYGINSVDPAIKYKRFDMQGFDEFCNWQVAIGAQKSPSRYHKPIIEHNGKVITYKDALNKHYGPDYFVTEICDFISRKKENPFFVYFPMMLVHSPFEPTPDSEDKSSKNIKSNFQDMVRYTDKMVGQIKNHLQKEGLLDNTLIIFTGDNGTLKNIVSTLNGVKYRGGKSHLTNNGTWAPMVVYWSKTKTPGKVIDDLVDFTDFLPTLAEAANAKIPNDLNIDGRSFFPQIKGEKGNPREWVCMTHDTGNVPQFDKTNRCVRDKRYKLYQDGRFFDLEKDLQEFDEPLNLDKLNKPELQAYSKLKSAIDNMPKWNPITRSHSTQLTITLKGKTDNGKIVPLNNGVLKMNTFEITTSINGQYSVKIDGAQKFEYTLTAPGYKSFHGTLEIDEETGMSLEFAQILEKE